MELFAGLAVVLLIVGVVGSFLPMVPGALLSIAGVSVYWWSTGFTQPNIFVVVLLYLTGLTALLFDLFAGAIGSKAGGASDRTVHAAAVAGVLFFFIGGPVGTIVGITLVVYFREYLLTNDSGESRKAALYTTASMLGSTVVQGVLTGLMLIIFGLTLFM
ncbi:MAG: DUF456 domain-containing protein [Candidatus Nanohalobium sp.]